MSVSSQGKDIEDWINEDWIILLLLEETSSVQFVIHWDREVSFLVACPVGKGGIQLPVVLI